MQYCIWFRGKGSHSFRYRVPTTTIIFHFQNHLYSKFNQSAYTEMLFIYWAGSCNYFAEIANTNELDMRYPHCFSKHKFLNSILHTFCLRFFLFVTLIYLLRNECLLYLLQMKLRNINSFTLINISIILYTHVFYSNTDA